MQATLQDRAADIGKDIPRVRPPTGTTALVYRRTAHGVGRCRAVRLDQQALRHQWGLRPDGELGPGRPIEAWRLWLLGGTVAGTALVAIPGESPQFGLGYGVLGELLLLGALVLVLFAGGLLIGFGARWAGACTSGHGLSGCATRSPGSLVAVMTFMVTAVGVTLLLHLATGGRL